MAFQQPNLPIVPSKEEALLAPVSQAVAGLPSLVMQWNQYKRGREKDELAHQREIESLGYQKDRLAFDKDREGRMAVNQDALISIRQQLADLAGKKAESGAAAKDEKAAAAKLKSQEDAKRVVETVDRALEKVGPWTAGAGSWLSKVRGTPAKDLDGLVKTIQANLAFDRLQEMRNNSPTGGALGQVAVAELDLLQSAVESLDTKQSPEQLTLNLQRVKTHYEKWKNAVTSGSGPSVGAVEDGYKFKGGNPADKANWEKV